MTTPQVDGRTFQQNLPNITYKSPVSNSTYYSSDAMLFGPPFVTNNASTAFYVGAKNFTAAAQFIPGPGTAYDRVNAFFASLGNNFPTSLTDLVTKYAQYNIDNAVVPFTQPPQKIYTQSDLQYLVNGGGPNNLTGFLPLFLRDYRIAVGVGDWTGISPSPTDAQLISQMEAWSRTFFSTYQPNLGSSTPFADFFSAMGKALPVTAGVLNSSTLSAENPNTYTTFGILQVPIPNQAQMPRFQTIYNTYYPGATTAQFNAALTTFYNQQIASVGYFNPSQSLEVWTQYVIHSTPIPFNIVDTTSLASIGAKKAQILNNIYVLIATLLNSLQGIAAVESSRLNLLTQWQNAYSNQISTLHSFLSTDNSPILDNGDTARASIRGALNDLVNSNYRSLMQNNQQIIGDDSKSLQSNINQVQDSVSQQNNRATAIIQELGTLLNAIFK